VRRCRSPPPAATPAESAVPNRLLRREGEIGCAVVAPVDALDRPATGSTKEA
jgi:hypothetical protein